MPSTISEDDAAELLGTTLKGLHHYRALGRLHAVEGPTGVLSYRVDEINRLLEARRVVIDPESPEPRAGDDGELDAIAAFEEWLTRRDAPETRRTPVLRPLFMDAGERYDFDHGGL